MVLVSWVSPLTMLKWRHEQQFFMCPRFPHPHLNVQYLYWPLKMEMPELPLVCIPVS